MLIVENLQDSHGTAAKSLLVSSIRDLYIAMWVRLNYLQALKRGCGSRTDREEKPGATARAGM